MRQPWSPPWRITTIWGRSLAIGLAEWDSRQVQPWLVVLLGLALVTPGQAVYGSVLAFGATERGVDRQHGADVGVNWVGRQSLVVPYAPDGPDDVVGGFRDAL